MLRLFKKKKDVTPVAGAARVPQHIAFICDGNRRWAEARGLPPLAGHQAGIANFENLVDWFIARGVTTITFFLFSTENKSLMILNLFPFKIGIEMPVYLYTILLFFISFIAGILANKIYNGTKSFKKKKGV